MSTLTEFQYLVEVVRQITLDSIDTLWGRQKFDDEKMNIKKMKIQFDSQKNYAIFFGDTGVMQ